MRLMLSVASVVTDVAVADVAVVAGSAHAKAYNASAVTAMHAGHSSWKLVL